MAFKIDGPLVLAGVGKMGAAMLSGWLARGLDAKQVVVQEPQPSDEVAALLSRHGIANLAKDGVASLTRAPAVLVMAVKPQIMDEVFAPLAAKTDAHTLTLSVAAGRTIASFANRLPGGAAIIRAMPNTPAAIGRGMIVCSANAGATPAQKALCDQLMAAVGEVAWVEDESLIDAVTAVSGSGPAYVFLLAECLAEAGIAAGLPSELAARLARVTVAGAGELMHQSASVAPAELRRNVTSPGGTTAAALEVLMGEGGLRELLTRAVIAARERGRALAK